MITVIRSMSLGCRGHCGAARPPADLVFRAGAFVHVAECNCSAPGQSAERAVAKYRALRLTRDAAVVT